MNRERRRVSWRTVTTAVLGVILLVPLAAAAAPLGNPIRISGSTEGAARPSVVSSGRNSQYIVVWQHGNLNPQDIRGNVVGPDGTPVGGAFEITGASATKNHEQWEPALACSTMANRCLAVWTDSRRSSTRGLDIFGQITKRDGTRVGGSFRVSGKKATGSERHPTVVYNPVDDEYLVVFEEYRTDPVRPKVFGRRIGGDGTLLGGQFRISSRRADNARIPDVAHDPDSNEYLVVWRDNRRFPDFLDFKTDIFGRRLAADGARLGRDFRVSGRKISFTNSPAITYNGVDHEFLVVWVDSRRHGYDAEGLPVRGDVFGRRMGSDGPRSKPFRISGNRARPEIHTSIREVAAAHGDSSNSYLVAWNDGRDVTSSFGEKRIFGQSVSADGTRGGPDFLVSGASNHAAYPEIVYNSDTAEFLVAFSDYRLGDGGVFVRRMTG